MELRGSVVVVTGASSGFGWDTAIAFARRGGAVALAARRLERLEKLRDHIESRGGRAIAVGCDVRDPDQLAALHQTATEELGEADVLINNAGIPGGGDFIQLSREQIERVVQTNLMGVLYGTHEFLPGMIQRGRGHIVNVASLAGRFATPGASVYTATKHAVVAFSESLHHEVADHGVKVTTVNPALAKTEGFEMKDVPEALLLASEQVAEAIVKVVERGIAPEYSVPRWIAPLQLFRILTPPLYRWGVRTVRKGVGRASPVREE